VLDRKLSTKIAFGTAKKKEKQGAVLKIDG
jgi:hypothetical protein